MSRIVSFMARWRTTWVLWMSLGTLVVAASALLDFVLAVGRAVRTEWREQRWVFAEWFGAFSEDARLR